MWSLANAFLNPLKCKYQSDDNLASISTERLLQYFQQISNIYGERQILNKSVIAIALALEQVKKHQDILLQKSGEDSLVNALVNKVLKSVSTTSPQPQGVRA